MDGQPFFAVSLFLKNQAIDPGMIKVIEQDIIPQLEQRVPTQLKKEEQEPTHPSLTHRFVLVFDREGYCSGQPKPERESHPLELTTLLGRTPLLLFLTFPADFI